MRFRPSRSPIATRLHNKPCRWERTVCHNPHSMPALLHCHGDAWPEWCCIPADEAAGSLMYMHISHVTDCDITHQSMPPCHQLPHRVPLASNACRLNKSPVLPPKQKLNAPTFHTSSQTWDTGFHKASSLGLHRQRGCLTCTQVMYSLEYSTGITAAPGPRLCVINAFGPQFALRWRRGMRSGQQS